MESTIPDEGAGDSDRAYTRIDHGLVRVGNRWLERVWSGYMGYTTSLLQKAGEFEWVAAKNPEFSVDVDGTTLGPEDFGEVEWSEACDDLGATLVGVYTRTDIEVRVEHMAFHAVPCLQKIMTIHNRGRQKREVGPLIIESFELDQPEKCEYVTNLRTSGEPDADNKFSEIGTVVIEGRGLILIAESSARIALGSQDLKMCSVRIDSHKILAPSEFVWPKTSILIAFEGDSQSAFVRDLPDLQRRMRLHERQKAKRERENK